MFVAMDAKIYHGFYATPPLWTNKQFGIVQFEFPQLDLATFTATTPPGRLRLGHQMEFVFARLISYAKGWELLAQNLLVDHGKTRVGELDFLCSDLKTNTVYHIELAYKFYIINPEISEPVHRLMGPNKRDMCFTKLDKLKEKQFPLLYDNALDAQLEQLQIKRTNITQQACFKAQLFLPYKQNNSIPRPLNKNCMAGTWIRFDDFSNSEFKNFNYYIPFKQEWVITPQLERTYRNHFETLMDVNLRMVKENAPMLWMKKQNGNIEKLFVVWW